MNGRRMSGWLAAAFGLALALPGAADAQVRIRVNWEFGNDRFYTAGSVGNGYVTARIPRIGVVHYEPVRYEPVWGVRIPRGFRPGYGMCRLWYPGVPPGRQPHPIPCDALYGQFHPDVLIVTWRGVMRPVWNQRLAAYYGYSPRTYIRDVRYDGRLGRVVAYDGRYRWDDRRYRNWWDDRYDDWWYDDRWDDRGDRWDDRRDRWDDRWDRWEDRRERDYRGDRDDRWYEREDRDDRWNRNDRGNNGRGQGNRPGLRPGQDGDRGNGARGNNGRGNGNRPSYRPGQGNGRSGAASVRAPGSRPAVAARTVKVRGNR